MDIAERYGSLLRRSLCSAEALRLRAIFFGSFSLNRPAFRSSASLVSVTWADHLRPFGRASSRFVAMSDSSGGQASSLEHDRPPACRTETQSGSRTQQMG